MKQIARLGQLALLTAALATVPAGCGGGGGSGGGERMYILSCVLGCNNGNTGNQVTCGIVNTFVNQDVSIQFNASVDLNHVLANPSSFRVFETQTGISPPGDILLDPANSTRLIFRPKLSFSPLGTPSYGFKAQTSYQIVIPGTVQGDPGPYVKNTGGSDNQSRLLCTITTDQGITDPVPGKPMMEIYVEEIIPGAGGQTKTTEINDLGPTSEVASNSPITFIFRDIMNLGTVVTPVTSSAPFITIEVDPDANIATSSNRTKVSGSYTFDVDEDLLMTTAVFKSSAGFPSGGSVSPRIIVISVPPQVIDLVGNSVANGGLSTFSPEVQVFGTVTLPEPSGEQFLDAANMDVDRTSSDWGETQLGRLKPGTGGGSGRLGDLGVGLGQTVTLHTSPRRATGYFDFSFAGNPSKSDQVEVGDGVSSTVFEFKINPATPTEVKREKFVSYSLLGLAGAMNASADAWVAAATYTVEGKKGDRLVVTYDVPGAAGNAMTLNVPQGPHTASDPNLSGGTDSMSFGGPGEIGEDQIVTNFDFSAPGAETPPPITVDDGVFEFARVEIKGGGTLRLEGDNPARLLARGQLFLNDQGVIDVTGGSPGPHWSDAPLGQVGPDGGAGASPGGLGADRPDNTGTDLLTLSTSLPYSAGIEFPPTVIPSTHAPNALGVGMLSNNGGGKGGKRWPNLFPTKTFALWQLETDALCDSEQVGGAGSGGAYSTDGGLGVAMANNPISFQGGSNTPADTPGGDSAQVGLPPAGPTTGVGKRTLDPNQGWLLGGAAGAGGGSNVSQTHTTRSGAICIGPSGPGTPTPITIYRSHSGAAGGAGGGGIQIQAGRRASISGVISAGGGDGGGFDSSLTDPPPLNGRSTAPGGGGSGGAVLVQSDWVDLSGSPARLVVTGGGGGLGEFSSQGGAGGVGLVRAEDNKVGPSGFLSVAPSVAPFDNAVADQTDPSVPTAAIHWLSVDAWPQEMNLPESFSAGQSCWMKPGGNFFTLTFPDDTDPATGQFDAWSMDLKLDFGTGEQTFGYRKFSQTFFGGMTPQQFWGELYAEGGNPGAPIVVRFQGAKSTGAITDPCNLDPTQPFAPIDPDSLTPWVRHPFELNDYSPTPDMVRFLVLFDNSHPDAGFVKGVTNLQIKANPD